MGLFEEEIVTLLHGGFAGSGGGLGDKIFGFGGRFRGFGGSVFDLGLRHGDVGGAA